MISVSNNFKSALTQPRQIDAKIIYGNNTITSDDINSIRRSFNSELFKTIAKVVDIDSNTPIDKGTTINVQSGLYVDDDFEYLSLGNYRVLESPTMNKDTNSYQIYAYDKIVDSMVLYDLTNSDITYPCTVRQLFVAIFTKLNWNTSGIPATFVNSTSQIESDVYSNMNMTYRDVLDELCTISCLFLVDKEYPRLIQPTTTSETIDENYISDTNVEIGEQVFFNSLVFSRVGDTDNIYRKDDESIAQNGLKEYKVKDLQILSLNWRGNFIDAMWNYIKEFNYYSFDINTIGIMFLEPIDNFILSIFNTTYNTILLNSDLTIGGGINEKIYSNKPSESETEYKYASEQDKKNGQTTLTIDKRLKIIESEISNMPIITTENSGIGTIKLQDLAGVKLAEFKVHPTNQDILGLLASNSLIASNDLIVRNREIVFKKGDFKAQFDLPPLYYYNDDIYDEFIYNTKDKQAYVIRRVAIDNLGNKSILSTPIVIDFEYKDIQLEEGNYTIYVSTGPTAYIYAKGMLKNEYTETFATSYEVDSKITQEANRINAIVSEKVDENEVIASLNLAVENNRGIVELKGNSVIIESDNFELDRYGNAIFKNANIYLQNGSKIFGDDGLMSTILINSSIRSQTFFGGNGLMPCGFSLVANGQIQRDYLALEFEVPNDFVITGAKIILSHAPISYTTSSPTTGYTRNLKLFKSSDNKPRSLTFDNQYVYFVNDDTNYSEVVNAFGENGFTGSSYQGTQTVSVELKDYITTGYNTFKIQSMASTPTQAQIQSYTGACMATLYITGFTKFEEPTTPTTLQTPLLGGGLLGGELNQDNKEPLNVGEPMNTNIEEESDM